jgi:hypothetical protein
MTDERWGVIKDIWREGPMTELLEALRQPNRAFGVYKNRSLGDLCREAADEIERLRAALKDISGATVDGASLVLIGAMARNALETEGDAHGS